MFNDTDILIEENTDLEKTITDYKDNYMNKPHRKMWKNAFDIFHNINKFGFNTYHLL